MELSISCVSQLSLQTVGYVPGSSEQAPWTQIDPRSGLELHPNLIYIISIDRQIDDASAWTGGFRTGCEWP